LEQPETEAGFTDIVQQSGFEQRRILMTRLKKIIQNPEMVLTFRAVHFHIQTVFRQSQIFPRLLIRNRPCPTGYKL
jgi:hypothetical protein